MCRAVQRAAMNETNQTNQTSKKCAIINQTNHTKQQTNINKQALMEPNMQKEQESHNHPKQSHNTQINL